jgi:hypothetical protein
MIPMSNKSNNGTNKNASNARKGTRGPRPIMTVAQLREKLLREMLIKEGRKVERKIGKLLKREAQLQLKLDSTRTQLDNLRITLAEFNAELGA